MAPFNDWCDVDSGNVAAHRLTILTARAAAREHARDAIAETIPTHYCSEENIARALARLGKTASAQLIEQKLPTTKSIRSGDLGEILATEYIEQQTEFGVAIKRLRWKDHRNMAMRGEDVIAMRRDPALGRLRFLKCEAKSRGTLTAGVVNEARNNLEKHGGLPSGHALTFISARLLELGQAELADEIEDALLKHGILPAHVEHLLFVLSGNEPRPLLEPNLVAYAGTHSQSATGLQIEDHGAFVRAVYEQVIADA